MSINTLVIMMSKGDSGIGKRIYGGLNGLMGTRLLRYSSIIDAEPGSNQLGSHIGDPNHPLILVGHATGTAFSTEGFVSGEHFSATQRTNGALVAETLLQRGLRADTFPFCFITGCNAASVVSQEGVFACVGRVLQIPVVAATTPVNLGLSYGAVTSTVDGGSWKVYWPLSRELGEVVALDAPQCSAIRQTLEGLNSWFQVS